MKNFEVTFTATDPCARISDDNLESLWWRMLGRRGIDMWGLEMTPLRDKERENRLIARSAGLVLACTTPEGGILSGISSVVREQIETVNAHGLPVYTQVPLEICLAHSERGTPPSDYQETLKVIDATWQIVIGNDLSKITAQAETGVK